MTYSMLHRDELVANPRGNNLNTLDLDAIMVAALALDTGGENPPEAKREKKKGLRGWVRGIFGRK
jgi:hypothetical protein